ncbi:MAG: phosphonate metabolism protein PhnP [Methylococcales bacterium]|nr:phosphonate metabolism protein PhnP [Methylococcales bacterium]
MEHKARLRFLGTGSAEGAPVYGCACSVCQRARFSTVWQRGPCSAHLEVGGESILLDAGGADLKFRFPHGSLSMILLTHFHPDHVQGLFALRWGVGEKLPVFAPDDPEGLGDLYKHPGILDFQPLKPWQTLTLDTMLITPVPLVHSKPTLGYCFEGKEPDGFRLAYLTDTVGLPKETEEFLQHWQPTLMVLDASHPPQAVKPRNHNDLNLALAIHQSVAPKKTVLTHIGHQLDVWLEQQADSLPDGVAIGRDGQQYLL